MLAFLPGPTSSAASNTATTLFPLDGPNQLETHTTLDCYKANGHCDFTAGADMRTPDGVTGSRPAFGRARPPRFGRRTEWLTSTRTPPATTRGS
jgi:hypothetical protein